MKKPYSLDEKVNDAYNLQRKVEKTLAKKYDKHTAEVVMAEFQILYKQRHAGEEVESHFDVQRQYVKYSFELKDYVQKNYLKNIEV